MGTEGKQDSLALEKCTRSLYSKVVMNFFFFGGGVRFMFGKHRIFSTFGCQSFLGLYAET